MPTPRILIVEDDPQVRGLVSLLSQRAGIGYAVAADGRAAIAIMESAEFDLVLLDLMMPHVDGYCVVDWLAQRPRPRPPVIVMTAGMVERPLDPEVVICVLKKPFDSLLMIELIAELASRLSERDASAPVTADAEPAGDLPV